MADAGEKPGTLDLAALRLPDVTVEREQIIGLDNALNLIDGLVFRLAHPEQLPGADAPRGILFRGEPGTGKTLCARYLASRLAAETRDEVPFYVVSHDQLTPGNLRAAVRELDGRAGRSVLYLDEADQLLRETWRARDPLLLAAISALDGLDSARPGHGGALLIISTNLQTGQIDSGLLRGGRIGHRIVFQTPDQAARERMLGLFVRDRSAEAEIDLRLVAQISAAMSGAGLRQAVDDAAAMALAAGRARFSQEDLVETVTLAGDHEAAKIQGPAQPITIIHELGHAIVQTVLRGPEAVDGLVLGEHTAKTIHEREGLRYEVDMLTDLVTTIGGRVAEAELNGSVSLGSANDLEAIEHRFLSLLANGYWPNLAYLAESTPHPDLRAAADLDRLADYRAALLAWAEGEARRIVCAHQTTIAALAERLSDGRRAVGQTEWRRLIADFDLPRTELTPPPPRDDRLQPPAPSQIDGGLGAPPD